MDVEAIVARIWPGDEARVEVLGGKARVELARGDRLRIETPGGGGYGMEQQG